MSSPAARSHPALPWMSAGLAWLLLILLLPIDGNLVVSGIFKDIFVPLSAAWHVLGGGLPHRDFWTPIGPLYAWLQAWPFLVFGRDSAVVLAWANVPLALWATLSCLLFARGRLPALPASALAVGAALVCISPRLPESGFMSMVHLASYNRGGWGLLAALLPLLCGGRRPSLAEGVAVGVTLALLFLTKAVFAVPALLFLLLVRPPPRVLIGAAAPPLLAAAALHASGVLVLYLAQIADVVRAGESVLRLNRLPETVWANYLPLLVAAVLLMVAWKRPSHRGAALRLSLAIGLLVGATLQAHDYPSLAAWLAMLPAMTVIGAAFAWTAPGALAGLLLASPVWLFDLGSLATHRWASARPAVSTLEPERAGTPQIWEVARPGRPVGLAFMGPSFLRHGYSPEPSFAVRPRVADAGETAWFFTTAAAWIDRVAEPQDRILDLGFTTPWPFLLGRPSLRGAQLWMHPGRTISETRDLSLEALAGGATLIVIPEAERVAHHEPWTVRRYRAAIEESWILVLRTPEISVWRRPVAPSSVP